MAVDLPNPFKQSSSSKGFLNNVNRPTYNTNKEFLTTGIWDFDFTKLSEAIYFPGKEVIASQIKSIEPPNPLPAKIMEYNHRGFMMYQADSRVPRNGDVKLTFTDFEDGSIVAMINSWVSLQSDPETLLGLRKEFLKCNLTLTRLNTSGMPVNRIYCQSGLISSVTFKNDFSNTQELIAEQSFTLRFEYVTFEQLNK
jgi:hypothetical protein